MIGGPGPRGRGRLTGARPASTDLALLLLEEYVHVPPPTAGATAT
jgi:hypothetical protein